MQRPWFKLRVCDEDFLRSAPQRQVAVFEVPQPAGHVWAELTSERTLDWCRALSGVTWTSPRPFGEGTTRTVGTPLGLLVLKEVYFRWEEGFRKSFYVSEATLPLFRRFAEDYIVEETSPSSCRFTWTVASESPPAARPGTPINALITRNLFADTRRHFGAS
ncbi:MAG: SRPBCC family protein [Solirubrobacteraceae bacterium]